MSQKSILVAGGAGFIGFNFINKCLSNGYKVLNIDDLTYSANSKESRNIRNKNYKFIKLNIKSKKINLILKRNNILQIVNFAII